MITNKLSELCNLQKIFCFFIILIISSCTKKNDINHDFILNRIPTVTTENAIYVEKLHDYKKSFDLIDLNKTYEKFKDSTTKEDFKNQMTIFRTTYNECISFVNQINHDLEAQSCLTRLNTTFKYILINFKI